MEHSIALQDAAVQSATSLMAVMNDMLRSPHVSAHLHKRSTSLQPMHGRPRSHTAPSTPLAEASFPDPVELPGCPPHQRLRASLEQAADGKSITTPATASNASIGHSIERPHTSPQESVHPFIQKERNSLESSGRQEHRVQYPFSPDSYRAPATKDMALGRQASSLPGDDESNIPSGTSATASNKTRPVLSVLQPSQVENISKPLVPASLPAVRRPSVTVEGLTVTSATEDSNNCNQTDVEEMLMQQLSSMRAAHEAHIVLLKAAHEKQLESQRLYIDMLERHCRSRRTLPAAIPVAPRGLTIDTSQASRRLEEASTSNLSTAVAQSFESPLESQKRSSHDSNAETESLRRKLSLLRRSQSESTETRRERDQLRDSLDRSDRRILQLKDIVRKAKENEKALKNAAEDLKGRLEEANNERMDVREGLHQACVQVRRLTERGCRVSGCPHVYQTPVPSTNASYSSLVSTHSDQTHERSKHSRTRSEMSLHAWSHDPLLAQVRQLQSICRERHARILELEASKTELTNESEIRLEKLERNAEAQSKQLTEVEADRDRYELLLRKEMRRRTRLSVIAQASAAIPEVEAEATGSTQERLAEIYAECASSVDVSDTTTEAALNPAIALLEKELKACMSEIIMYKLDVAGYKKDLKKANTELERLRALDIQQPPLTPDRSSTSSTRSRSRGGRRRPSDLKLGRHSDTSGLGISVARAPKTPTQSLSVRPREAEDSSKDMTSLPVPAMSPKTPSNTHKKLPKTPVACTPSPLPRHSPTLQSLQRGETLRSLSESIISSYTKRTPPVAEAMGVSRRTLRASDSMTVGSPAIPVRRERSEQEILQHS